VTIRALIQYVLWKARKRKSLGFSMVCLALIISLLGNALTFYIFDASKNPELDYFDCIWYSFISISTIGYGDLSATSLGARIGTLIFIVIIGLAAFTTFFGIILDWFMDLHEREKKGMSRVHEKGHVIIVNFPSAHRVKQVIEELAQEEGSRKRPIVIVTDTINELPFTYPDVSFVHGSPVEEESYDQANIAGAGEAIVLCTAPDDPNSDSVVASIVSIIEHIKPDLYTVAECLNAKHRRLFESSSCDSIVCSTRIANNLLVHESQDKGVINLVDVITTHKTGDTLFTLKVGETGEGEFTAIDLAKVLLDNAVNLLCINRGRDTFTDFTDIQVRPDDILVYIGKKRVTWEGIRSMAASAE
jgi:voltage-gated potassium channel